MFTGTLKPYQVEAVERMAKQKKMLVAYEMGLGKTCMTIAALEELRERKEITQPTLVIVLASLKYQWEAEITKFSNATVTVVDGSKAVRTRQYVDGTYTDYIVTNYESIVNDWELLKGLLFDAIVCDEATAIKGFRSKRSKKVKELATKIPVKYALTGTPIENGKPEELYSIMQFVEPSMLGRFDLFDNLPLLHEKIKEASVRKAQSDPDVAPYLPATIHLSPIKVRLNKPARTLYDKIKLDLTTDLEEAQSLFGGGFSLDAIYGQGQAFGGPVDAMRGAIMSKITALRMVCDSPSLLVDSSTKYKLNQGLGGSSYASYLDDEGYLENLDLGASKLDAVVSYVVDHLETDELSKVVIFTSYIGMLTLLQNALAEKKIKSRIYSGQLNAKEKEDSKLDFQNSKEVRVLISSDAGGYGVDLPQANLLVNYDLPWSAGKAVQRNSRIRRASSKWPSVIIQDFLVLNSIEERQFEMLNQKNLVADAVVDGTGINIKGGVDLTVGSLLNFLLNATI